MRTFLNIMDWGIILGCAIIAYGQYRSGNSDLAIVWLVVMATRIDLNTMKTRWQ